MAYNWAQLAFVEKWRLQAAVRGQIIGMYHPEDKTFFDLRLRPGEGNVGQIPGSLELHLVDAGNLIREKRIGLMDRAAVVVRLVAQLDPAGNAGSGPSHPQGRSRRWLEPGSRVTGKLVHAEEDVLLVDVGFPVVVQLPDGGDEAAPPIGSTVHLQVEERPKGFLVI